MTLFMTSYFEYMLFSACLTLNIIHVNNFLVIKKEAS